LIAPKKEYITSLSKWIRKVEGGIYMWLEKIVKMGKKRWEGLT
jgi:hypothetical protein